MFKISKHQKLKNNILQIIDISSQVKYDLARGEKKLLSTINATVSHEMRTPVNSIYSQNILQKQLNNELKEIIYSSGNIDVNRLKSIHQKYVHSVRIQTSSTKLLTYLVNDILDFGQLKAGKFRKDCLNFNLRESIEEIILILQYKAEMYGISFDLKFSGFPSIFRNASEFSSNYIVNSDQ